MLEAFVAREEVGPPRPRRAPRRAQPLRARDERAPPGGRRAAPRSPRSRRRRRGPRVVEVPVRLDASFLGKLLEAQVFDGPGATLRIAGRDRCSGAVLAAPPVALAEGRVGARDRRPRAGRARRLRRLPAASSPGEGVARGRASSPTATPAAPVVRFRVLGSELRPRSWTLLPQERLWGWIQPARAPAPRGAARRPRRRPSRSCAALLPLFVREGEAGPARRLAESLALGAVRAERDAVVVLVRFEVDERRAPPPLPRRRSRPRSSPPSAGPRAASTPSSPSS